MFALTNLVAVLAVSCLVAAAPAPVTSPATGSWSEAVAALAARNQSWAGRQVSPLSDFQFDIGCIGDGPAQSPQFTDIFDAVSNWFSGSNTGPTCASNQARGVNCSSGTGCFYQGSYAVWNNGIADCFSFVALQNAVKLYCADAGHQDCGCGVYYDFGSGKCLVASYTYHVSGPSTVNNQGITGEPVNVVTNVNFNKRDSLGPYYTDLEICGHTGSGDVSAWCESSATHGHELVLDQGRREDVVVQSDARLRMNLLAGKANEG
ncbi:hypothetical protein AURDEDRAFT_121288 [Auricularia subglabra TFB-10046 SS5]|nr:hypothetical protein AURDEDRAFT_121288 [Auricularia subglabra TFB-10046 SS5]